MDLSSKKEVKTLFEYPIMEAIARRRSRRFPVGCNMTFGPLQYESKQPSTPLNDLELALLCWAGAGITGAITNEDVADLPSWVGHANASGHNAESTKLFFTSDKGTFLYTPKTATKVVEIDTEADRNKIMTDFEKDCHQVLPERVEMFSSAMLPSLTWNINKPGTSVFIPVVETIDGYIQSVIASLVFSGYQIFDDIKNKSAGLQKWIDSGDLKGPKVTLTSFEKSLQRGIFTAPAYIMMDQIHLVAEAMGLGSVMFAGYTGEVMLGITQMGKGLGFRTVKDKDGNLNPVGFDGYIEPHCPPYYKDMNAAIDAIVASSEDSTSPLGPEYNGILPFEREFWKKIRPQGHHGLSPNQINMIKSFLNYVYDTYGRLPVTFNGKSIPIWLQVHHLEVGFYEKFYSKGMVTEAQKNHMKIWHS
jgi:hypothetical protein